MLQYVYSVDNPKNITIFHADTGLEAAEKMVYTLGLKNGMKLYDIRELKKGYEIDVNGECLYWVKK